MSKFTCECGHHISNVSWPANHEAKLVTEWDWDTFSDYSVKPLATVSFGVPYRKIIECTQCGRLWISDKIDKEHPNIASYRAFKPEGERLRFFEEHD